MNQRTAIRLLLVLVFLIAGLYAAYHFPKLISYLYPTRKEFELIKRFSFSETNALEEWQEKVLHKHVLYTIESKGDESYIRALSNRSCSALYHKVALDLSTRPVLTWKWRAQTLPDKKTPDNLLDKKQDDYVARMYVIFPAFFFSRTKVIEYVWANDAEIGTISSSPYTKNIKLMVVESGPHDKEGWVEEKRDLYEDYLQAFDAEPKYKMGSIAFMCDSDSTKSLAEAHFDDISIFIPK